MARPIGFDDFVKRQGFHTIYLVTPEEGHGPVKVGVAVDPYVRFSSHQSSNFIPLRLHRFWWVAGQRVALRIESTFKDHFKPFCVRGEWFDLLLPLAEAFIEGVIRGIGTWGVSEGEVIDLFEQHELHRTDFYPSGYGVDGLRRR
ncbi:MAG: GIY-YIG nuclease family protein [Alphaproteobacteria bacterium]